MHVASLVLALRLDACPTPRQRRRALDAIAVKLRRHFNISLAELEPATTDPELARLAVAAVARSRREARDVLHRVLQALEAHPHAAIVPPVVIHDR
jgi:uncharacterized protein YlxP (DUF503 family)